VENCRHRFYSRRTETQLPGLQVFTYGCLVFAQHSFHCLSISISMHDCQIIGMCIVCGDGVWQFRDVDVKKGFQDESLWDAVLEASQPALLPLPVVRVKLRLPTISMIMRTVCLSGKNRTSLQVRLRCHAVSQAAVRSSNTSPAFFLAAKLSTMSYVSRVSWFTVDFPCRKPACSVRSSGWWLVQYERRWVSWRSWRGHTARI